MRSSWLILARNCDLCWLASASFPSRNLDRPQTAEAAERGVEFADKLFVGFRQTIIPYKVGRFFQTHDGRQYSASGVAGPGSRKPSPLWICKGKTAAGRAGIILQLDGMGQRFRFDFGRNVIRLLDWQPRASVITARRSRKTLAGLHQPSMHAYI